MWKVVGLLTRWMMELACDNGVGVITHLTIIINVQIAVQVLVEVNSVICGTAFPWSYTEQRMCAIICVEIT